MIVVGPASPRPERVAPDAWGLGSHGDGRAGPFGRRAIAVRSAKDGAAGLDRLRPSA